MYEDATKLLYKGGVGVLPTDTVYGLVARAQDEIATTRLYKLKKRENKPGTLIAANINQLITLGISEQHLAAARQFWPGPVSVIIPVEPQLDYLSQTVGSLAIRIPNNPELIELLKQTGPLTTTSANQPGKPPANTVAEAQKYFGNQVDFYVDGGDLSSNAASTIIKITDGKLTVLRQGAAQIS